MMQFGVCFAPDPPPRRWVDLAKLAEDRGFDYVWLWDSHVLWQEVYPVFTLMAAETERIRIGPLVTNPVTRDPTVTASALATLDDFTDGRMVMGIGRGDSARRVIGKTPVSVERMEWGANLIRDLVAGREVDYEGTTIQLKWARWDLPVWMAAYGPKALRAVGRVADGLVMQLADPFIIEWSLRYVREGAEEAGRSLEDIKIMSAAPTFVTDDLAAAREQVRWFPALVSNHVVDLVNRYASDELPPELTDYIRARDHYDYSDHGRRGAEHAEFVTDQIVDRFCVIGTLEQCQEKLHVLERIGVDQFTIYAVSVEGPDAIIETYGKEIIPEFTH
ncbi:MAG TPA: TIGR03842 family LLM class F420-dependent oxidoreductase [Actinomycetota bacterium]|jgi:probable F420-dependent oxidoreductase|nr:TIGR03842 family LLM class F420-dependent oxidoreductase [Actinomycetota bacterium]